LTVHEPTQFVISVIDNEHHDPTVPNEYAATGNFKVEREMGTDEGGTSLPLIQAEPL
jgi:hypothetical protein